MAKDRTKQLFKAAKSANQQMSGLTSKEKSALEKSWDIEHAYYSSALEGSKLDKQEFERLGQNIA